MRHVYTHRLFEPPLPLATLTSTVAAAVLAGLAPGSLPGDVQSPWPVLTAVAGAVILLFYGAVRRRRPLRRTVADAAIALVIVALVGLGLGWGLSALDLLGRAPPLVEMVVVMGVVSVGGAVTAAHGGLLVVVAAYVLPAFGLTAAALAAPGTSGAIAAAALLAGFGVALLLLSRQAQAFIARLAERQRAHHDRIAELTRGRDRLRTVLGAAPMPIVVARIHDGRVLFLNQFAREAFRYHGDISALPPAPTFYEEPEQRGEFIKRVATEGVVRNRELRMRRLNGEAFWALTSSSLIDYEGQMAVITSFNDITGAKARESELEHLATTDALTGIPNRRRFLEALEAEMSRRNRYAHPFALVMIDLDHFKAVNDTYGHAAGDCVLRDLVQLLSESLRTNDLLGRLGGEEFAILLPETGPDDALALARRLRQRVAHASMSVESTPLGLTISLGVVSCGEQDSVASLLRRADLALYEAKRGGRNQVVGENSLASATR